MASLTVTAYEMVEGKEGDESILRVVVSLSELASHDVTLSYATTDLAGKKNAASEGEDYTRTEGSLTIAAGTLSAVIEVPIKGDGRWEGNEIFGLVLSEPQGAGFAKGDTLTVTGTIIDDEPLLTVQGDTAVEGGEGEETTLRFVVTLSEPAAQDVSFKWATQDAAGKKNAAEAGSDYEAATGEVTIAAGQLSAVIEVKVLGDASKESDETFNLVLTEADGAGFAKGSSSLLATGTIVDDEPLVSIKKGQLEEGGDGETRGMVFEVSLSQPVAQDVTLQWTTQDASGKKNAATAGADYEAASGELVIPAGELSAAIEITVLGDGEKEGNEIFNVVLTEPEGAGFAKGESLTATGTIMDDEPVVFVQGGLRLKGNAAAEGGEGDANKVYFMVMLSDVSSQDVTLKYETQEIGGKKNAATSGVDFEAAQGEVTIAAGESTAVVEVTLIGDALREGNEIFNLVLSEPVGAGFAKGDTLVTQATVIDDEPVLSLKGGSVKEGRAGDDNSVVFVASLSAVAQQDVTFSYATEDVTGKKNAALAGEDYEATTGEITILAGQQSVAVSVPVLGDDDKEGNEVFNLVLRDIVGAGFAKPDQEELVAVGTIVEDEAILSIRAANAREGKDGDANQVNFVVSLSRALTHDVTLTYKTEDVSGKKNAAAAGKDYEAVASAQLLIPAGTTSVLVPVNILGDGVRENDEIFNLVLSEPQGAAFAKGETLSAVGTIRDDEPVLSIRAASAKEGGESDANELVFVVSLSRIAEQDVSVKYATADATGKKNLAEAGKDYVAVSNAELIIKAGETSGTIAVELTGDAEKEANEIFNLVLSEIDGAGFAKLDQLELVAVGTIIDDEPFIYA